MQIGIVGAGVIGMTTAVALKTHFPSYHVKIISETYSPDTTGDGSAGLWGPYILGETPISNILQWAGDTHRWMENLWKTSFAAKTGVTLIPVYRLTSNPDGYPKPDWTSIVYGAHELSPAELKKLSEEHKINYTGGWHFLSYTCEPVYFLPWLTEQFIAMGGKIVKRKVNSLHELAEDYDLIINCSGLGARQLAADNKVIPVRGQVARVKASWAMHVFIVDDDDGNYIIPNVDSIILGGTHQENDSDTSVRKEDSNFIVNGCCRMVPSLKGGKVLKEWVGLRPGRPQVRLESETLKSSRGKEFTVIHNYGHGGSGITLSWGCAMQVAKIVKNFKVDRNKSKLFLTICTSNCKYDVVRRVAARYGMKEVTEDSSWNLYWTDLSVSVERAKDMKRFQKVNHFPGMTEICRKDLLARNLNRMLKLFPKDYNFFPKTWCFPADHGEAVAYSKLRRSKTFIIKPDIGCQGRGIYLTKNLKDIKPIERMICQVYISKPYLIDGYKFDLRVYTLITSCDPLRIFVYNDGLARFATSRYKEPTGHNTSNVFMHLTNYAVNKHSRMYVIDDEIGSKRKISTLNKWLKVKDVDTDDLWGKIDEIIIKTVLAAHPILKHSYHTCFPTHDKTYACFELLGFDVLLDWKLKPYLLEVNHSPSFHTDAQIDKDIKESLLTDTFEILNLQECDKRKIIEEDKKRIRERLLQGINGKEANLSNTDSSCPSKLYKAETGYMERQHKWEDEHLGNFRRVYPCENSEKYLPYFKQTSGSVFQETAASRAREEAVKLQRDENELRLKEENKKIFGKWSEQKVTPESPNSFKKVTATQVRVKSKSAIGLRRTAPNSANRKKTTSPSNPTNALSSFEPEIISEAEERERIMALAQRDFLIRSYGLLEQIYMAMKINGKLSPIDERKYGIYEKIGYLNESQLGNTKNFKLQSECYESSSQLIERQYDSYANQRAEYSLKRQLKGNGI